MKAPQIVTNVVSPPKSDIYLNDSIEFGSTLILALRIELVENRPILAPDSTACKIQLQGAILHSAKRARIEEVVTSFKGERRLEHTDIQNQKEQNQDRAPISLLTNLCPVSVVIYIVCHATSGTKSPRT
mmetsp:Transcript_23787/g.54614  ORF Transcript_23787/g.54614 Transcript_23787/m.54614 type:complete len:129 (-) Transcript_23787:1742-2128(-)